MVTLIILATVIGISIVGQAWSQFEQAQATGDHGMTAKHAAQKILALTQTEAEVTGTRPTTHYDRRTKTVSIATDIAIRRDQEAVSAAAHEAAHAVQDVHHPAIMIVGGLSPALIMIGALAGLPWLIAASVTTRALIEIDAWIIADRSLRSMGLPGVKSRLAVACVVSYL